MRPITKKGAPPELSAYKSQSGAEYDGPHFTHIKVAIRESLLAEQGHICAYCMQRIDLECMKVEHWHSRAGYSSEQLEYSNLLGCCLGNEGEPRTNQHCDTCKRDSEISYNPANPLHHSRMKLSFLGDGTIKSEDVVFNDELNANLNLNLPILKRNRQAVLEGLKDYLGRTPGTRSSVQLERLMRIWEATDSEGKLQPFCEVAIFYLSRKLKR